MKKIRPRAIVKDIGCPLLASTYKCMQYTCTHTCTQPHECTHMLYTHTHTLMVAHQNIPNFEHLELKANCYTRMAVYTHTHTHKNSPNFELPKAHCKHSENVSKTFRSRGRHRQPEHGSCMLGYVNRSWFGDWEQRQESDPATSI